MPPEVSPHYGSNRERGSIRPLLLPGGLIRERPLALTSTIQPRPFRLRYHRSRPPVVSRTLRPVGSSGHVLIQQVNGVSEHGAIDDAPLSFMPVPADRPVAETREAVGP